MHLFGLIITPSSIALILIGAFTFTYWNKTIFNKQFDFYCTFIDRSACNEVYKRFSVFPSTIFNELKLPLAILIHFSGTFPISIH